MNEKTIIYHDSHGFKWKNINIYPILNLFLYFNTFFCSLDCNCTLNVTTQALGSRPRQGLAKVWAKYEARSHMSCSRECKKVRGNEPSHSQVSSHFGSWSPSGLLNFQKSNCKGQNPLDGRIFYIIIFFLECKCRKWAHMTHLDT